MRNFWKSNDGATALEYAIIGTMLFILTFGIIDFGYALFQWEQAEKAAQVGVRVAVVRTPVVAALANFQGTGAIGVACGNSTVAAGPCYFTPVTITCNNVACGDIVTQMQRIFPRLQPQNVQVTYAPTRNVGTTGAAPVPAIVSVGIVGMTYNFFALNAFLPALGQSLPIPPSTATLTSEGFGNS
jgi:Flp pilus assembly protein TadG